MSAFNQQLWDKAQVVIKHSNTRRKQLQEFITILSKRIDIEETYAKSLEQNSKMAQKVKQGDQNIPQYAFTSFKQNCANRSSQTRTFAKSLRQQILMPLRSLVANQQQQTKILQKDWKKMDKQIQQLQYNIIKSKNRYDDQYNDYEEMLMINEITLESHKVSKDKRSKLIAKTNELMKGLNELERNYQRAISDYNTFLAQFYLELVKILDTLQKQQEARLAAQQQNIMKILVFQTSMNKNFQYDINTITKQVEKIKKIDHIRQFVDKHKTGRQREKGQSRHLRKNMLGQSIYRIINKDMEKRVALENNKDFKEYVDKKFKKQQLQHEFTLFKPQRLVEFQKLFLAADMSWKGQDLKEQQKQELATLLKDDVNRLGLWMYLHKFQSTNNIIISHQGYQTTVKLISLLLDICNQYQDVYVSRKITNLTFCIYQQKQNQKKHLHMGLNECNIYALTDYWKAAIFQTAQQELILHFEDNNNEEAEMKYMSLVLGQLAMFCHQMILLGVPSKEVRETVGWYCRLYEIPDDQNRDLARTVNASMKIYKQMFKPPEVVVPVVQQPVRRISFHIVGDNKQEQKKEQKVEQKITEIGKQQEPKPIEREEQKDIIKEETKSQNVEQSQPKTEDSQTSPIVPEQKQTPTQVQNKEIIQQNQESVSTNQTPKDT